MVDKHDYSAWNALLLVISERDAERAIRVLVPGLPLGESVRSIAADYLREAKLAQSNEGAYEALMEAVSKVRLAVGDEGFISCEYASRLFAPNTTDSEAGVWIWVRVLTHWVSEASAHPELASLLDSIRPALAIEKTGDPFEDDVPQWSFLVEFAQGRIVAGHLRECFASLPRDSQRELLEAFASTAESLGIPQEVLAVAPLNDKVSSRGRAN